jgi:hypothetical protein
MIAKDHHYHRRFDCRAANRSGEIMNSVLRFSAALTTALLLTSALSRGAETPAFTPGTTVHHQINDQQSCDLYLPSTYNPARPVRYPVALICTSPAAPELAVGPWIDQHHVHAWADERGVLVVSVNTPFVSDNAIELVGNEMVTAHAEVIDPVLRWISTIPAAHPATRIIFSTSPEAGGQIWSATAHARGAISGFIIGPGQTALALPPLPPNMDIALLHWDRELWDQTHPTSVLPVKFLMDQSGRWFTTERSKLGHALLDLPIADLSMDGWQRAADWLIDAHWLPGGPKILAAERAAALQRVSTLLTAALAEKDPAKALPLLDYLMSLPGIESVGHGRLAGVTWRTLSLAAAESQPTDFAKARALAAITYDKRFADTKQGATATSELNELKKNPDVVREANAANALDAAVQLDELSLLRGDPGLKLKAKEAYGKIVTDYPNTEAADRAANHANGTTTQPTPTTRP